MGSRLLPLFLVLANVLQAQPERPLQDSRYGWHLSPHGTIRVLVIFAEIAYNDRAGDPQPDGAEHWPVGNLPAWKDDMFDPRPLGLPKAKISRYYHDISLGNYVVLGDYLSELVTIRESEYGNVRSMSVMSVAAIKEANKQGRFRTAHGMEIADFDLWKDGGKPGMIKELGSDDPHSFDHVMVILRNSSLTHGQGSTDAGSSGDLFGYPSDTQSRFGAMYGLPFEILKHEFNHLLLGGNNFHSGGGNAAQFPGYFMPLQGGWSMMGGASSSLLTACAWDRYRLGWYPPSFTYEIRARNEAGQEVNGDIDPMQGDTGVYILGDFVTSGDALRIKVPFLPDNEYPQWIWLENHQTTSRNGSPTDRFHYEAEMTCVNKAPPGIYALMQVDREERVAANVFGGSADHLRPMPASGSYDVSLRGDTVTFQCLWPGPTTPYVVKDRYANPLTGHQDLELPLFDLNGDSRILKKENIVPRIEVRNGKVLDEGVFFGHSRHAFRPGEQDVIGMATNPGTSSMMTLVGLKSAAPNNRVVHLNPISIRIQEQRADGSIALHVRSDVTSVDAPVRWCADSIVLHPVKGSRGYALLVTDGGSVALDRSLTPTRWSDPENVGPNVYFSEPTNFVVLPGAKVRVEGRGRIELRNGSRLHFMPGSILELADKARIITDGGSELVLHPGSERVDLRKGRKRAKKVSQQAPAPSAQ
ncbi:MAG: hypothetical protein KDB97_09145 [Flavobacteriales bacterium]|nr:hypothetical protein [Flavobacteriales bacterium]